jgi:hypothetical protein
MSAPNAGRQSPPPERQSDEQIHKAPGSGAADGAQKASDENDPKGASESTKDNLESNPVHILQKHAEDTVSKAT